MTNPLVTPEEIENRFSYHRPVTDGSQHNTAPDHAYLRREYMRFAEILNDLLPNGRAKDLALTELENAAMWSHKAIAMLDPVHSE